MTRGEPYAGLIVDAPLGEVLPELVRRVELGMRTHPLGGVPA